MAVMARLEGIPSRIAVGYAPGRSTGATVFVRRAGCAARIRSGFARDAHAWPELYFQGFGWVPFEPTPSRGVVPDYAIEAGPPPAVPAPHRKQRRPRPVQRRPPAATPERHARATARPGPRWRQRRGAVACRGCGASTASCSCPARSSSPRLVRTGSASRRLRGAIRPPPADAVPLAWAELRDLGTDYGLPPGPAKRPGTYSARLRELACCSAGRAELDDAAHQAVRSLTADFERRALRPARRQSGAARPGTRCRRQAAVASAADRIAVRPASLRRHRAGRIASGGCAPPGSRRRSWAAWAALLAAPFRAVGTARPPHGKGRRALLVDGARRPAAVRRQGYAGCSPRVARGSGQPA